MFKGVALQRVGEKNWEVFCHSPKIYFAVEDIELFIYVFIVFDFIDIYNLVSI
jgi:hypothetical protein